MTRKRGAGEDVGSDVRVLVDEGGAVVDLLMDHNVEILLGAVSSDLLEGEFLIGRHDGSW